MRRIWNNRLIDPDLRFFLRAEAGAGGGAGGGEAGAGGGSGGGSGGSAGGGSGGAGAGAGAGGGAGGDPWYQPHVGTLDKDTLGWLDGKKFPSVTDALKSGAQAERMFRERNVIAKPDPAKMGEWEGWETFGWNKDKAAYGKGIKPPKMPGDAKHDEGLFDAAVSIGHELKMPPAMVEGFVQKLSDTVNARLGDLANQGREATTQMETKLRQDWGANYDANKELAIRAAKSLGIGVDDLSEIEKVTGNVRLLKTFHTIGAKMGEANLVGGDTGGTAGMTPASAEAELRRIEADPQFMKAFKSARDPGHQDAVEKWNKLVGIAAKGGNTQATRR